MFNVNEVAQKLGVSRKTIYNWYEYYTLEEHKSPNMPELPSYTKEEGNQSTRYWMESDIDKLAIYRDWMKQHRGKRGLEGRSYRAFKYKQRSEND